VDLPLGATLFGLGLFGGFLSGLVGLGGGIIMVPLLLYVPPALGVGAFTMKAVAGITSVQSFFGAVSGAIGHGRQRRVSRPLAIAMGASMAVSALVGSLASASLAADVLLAVFAMMAISASALMLIPRPDSSPDPESSMVRYDRRLAVALGAVIGLLSGIVGQGGAFLFLPAMLYLLNIPTRIAIGTGLVIGVASSGAVFIGRAGTAQIPITSAAIVVLGVVVGAQLGSILSQRTPRQALRAILALLIGATALKIWYELLLS
jgi:uncharacterized membrane protein YfcA